MFRPELTYDQKISRVSAAKTIMKNVENYTMDVSYGDSQRFRYSKKFPQLFLYALIIHVTYLHLLLLLLVLKTTEQYLCITNQKRKRFPARFWFGAVCLPSTQQFHELMVDWTQLNTEPF
jgi:hypothetical protein